jgi:radical SAM protein with 4Fe4S-binding SPASM domain
MEYGLDSLKWSVNFADKEQFSNMCGVKKHIYDSVIENIRSAYEVRRKFGYETKLYASSIRYDDDQGERMMPMLRNNILPYVDQHYWLPLYCMGSQTQSDLNTIAGNPGRYDNQVANLPCWQLFTEGHIMSDGSVTACGADVTGKWVMGDLKTQTFMDIWHSKEFMQLRLNHMNLNVIGTPCENCNK